MEEVRKKALRVRRQNAESGRKEKELEKHEKAEAFSFPVAHGVTV